MIQRFFNPQKWFVAAIITLSGGPACADMFDELDAETSPGTEGVSRDEQTRAEFEQFKKQRQAEYSAYKEQLLKEFAAYKLIVQEETNRYQGQLEKNWDEPEISNNTTWVDYSDDTLTRKSVDFENETITIEVPDSANRDEVAQSVRAALVDVVAKNRAEAFGDDVIAQAVEKRSKQEIEFLETATVEPEPILLTYLTGLYETSKREIEAIVDYMLENTQSDEVEVEPGRQVRKIKVPLSAPAKVLQAAEQRRPVSRTLASDVTGKLPNKAISLQPYVAEFAALNKIDQTLVFAIIESESAFNPMARSAVPAFGLMQIVPESAGRDVTKKLFGKERVLSPSYLYNSRQNIEAGTTYLNILFYRYP
jgi:membrane-bound lytic murein transglycosylase C